jgi:hypothetical protein
MPSRIYDREMVQSMVAWAQKRLREREADQRRALRARLSGRLCGALTQKGTSCARRAYANGLCGSHGGLNAGELRAQGKANNAGR